MNHKHIHTKTSICSWSENPIKTFWGQAQLNKSTIEICFGTFDTHTSSHIHVVKLSSQALQASINNCTLWPRYKALYLLSYLLLQVNTPTANQSLLLLQNPWRFVVTWRGWSECGRSHSIESVASDCTLCLWSRWWKRTGSAHWRVQILSEWCTRK